MDMSEVVGQISGLIPLYKQDLKDVWTKIKRTSPLPDFQLSKRSDRRTGDKISEKKKPTVKVG